jgi:hypothetical protein
MCGSTRFARTLAAVAACAALIACGAEDPEPPASSPPRPFDGEGEPWMTPVPRAACRPSDKPETGIQGLGIDVRCNLDVKSQITVEHFLSIAWYRDCAYVNGQTATTVLDVSDSTHPKPVTKLVTPGMQNNWESMKVHEGRGLLVGYQADAPILDIYDVKPDCKAPVLKSSFNLGGMGHAGNFSPDGTIYYASSMNTSQMFAVDISDPEKPRVITSDFARYAHDVSIAKKGTRGYFAFSAIRIEPLAGSFAILDLSSIQNRAEGASGQLIEETIWPDGWATQAPLPITYRGRDYLLITDELGSGMECLDPRKPPFGYARIFDIQDEQNPALVSKIKTEAQDPANCAAATKQAGVSHGVSMHYCSVDRPDNPRLLACGLWSGGVRLFDVRNPWRPEELAYFNVPGAQVPGLPRLRLRERELWVSTTTTFYVLGLPESVVDSIVEH